MAIRLLNRNQNHVKRREALGSSEVLEMSSLAISGADVLCISFPIGTPHDVNFTMVI
jgi:hypothetical protein